MSDHEHSEAIDIPELVTLGHPELARPSAPVPLEHIMTGPFRERLIQLQEAMVAYHGIGIAAPQVGWFERFFLMTEESREAPGEMELMAWINPVITDVSRELCWGWEGCLSVPGIRGWIRRPATVAVKGYDLNGEPQSREYTGWDARVFQHEFDHLEGMLFPYRSLDPRHLVSIEELERRPQWPRGWPAPGAQETPMGELFPDQG